MTAEEFTVANLMRIAEKRESLRNNQSARSDHNVAAHATALAEELDIDAHVMQIALSSIAMLGPEECASHVDLESALAVMRPRLPAPPMGCQVVMPDGLKCMMRH